MLSKAVLKKLLYSFRSWTLPADRMFQIGYIIHTECVYDIEIFDALIKFLDEFQLLTGNSALCVVMSGRNARIQNGLRKFGVSESEYIRRIELIRKRGEIGYHGHFWTDEADPENPHSKIRANKNEPAIVLEQMKYDLEWFRENLAFQPRLYSAGWWYIHPCILKYLIENNFTTDFSFSWSKPFRYRYAEKILSENRIKAGQSFFLKEDHQQILCVQNLIGCHTSPFLSDFYRNLIRLPLGSTVFGVVNTHDYDLDLSNTLACLRDLKNYTNLNFFSAQQASLLQTNNPTFEISDF